jgi:hypothetical protein
VSELILLDEARRQKAEADSPEVPHIQGPAICLACKHEWQAVIDARADPSKMECPSCTAMRGVFATHVEQAGDHWTCNCGNHLFGITRQGTYCCCCGSWQQFNFKGGA